MDANPRISLSFLYKNDPFYSLCLSDLMSASQSVTNYFLREQRNLTQTLKSINRHQLSRIGQLNEEKRQFALLMKRRLAPKVSVHSSLSCHPDSRRAFSTINLTDLPSGKCSIQSFQTISAVPIYRTVPAGSRTCDHQKWNETGHVKVFRANCSATLPKNNCPCRETPKRLTKSESCFPNLWPENSSKRLSHDTCRIKQGA